MIFFLILSSVFSLPQAEATESSLVFDPNFNGFNTTGTCKTDSDCQSGLMCFGAFNGSTGACGDIPDVPANERRGRMLITDHTAWQLAETAPLGVMIAKMLAPFAADAYRNPPTPVMGAWSAYSPQMGGDTSHNIMRNWNWLGVTVYGNQLANKYVIAFKGTDPARIQEILTDLTGSFYNCRTLSNRNCGRVHEGFYYAYAALKKQVYQALKDAHVPLTADHYVTGHSLGGALAIIAGMDLAMSGRRVRGLVTFGAPRVGDAAFENFFYEVMVEKKVNHARFAAINSAKNHQDVVTMLAPLGIPLLPYSRPVRKIIAGVSPACESWSLSSVIPCEVRLHYMEGSYMPMIDALYPAASRAVDKKLV